MLCHSKYVRAVLSCCVRSHNLAPKWNDINDSHNAKLSEANEATLALLPILPHTFTLAFSRGSCSRGYSA